MKNIRQYLVLALTLLLGTLLAQPVFRDIADQINIEPYPVKSDFGAGINLVDIDGNGSIDVFHLSEDASSNAIYFNLIDRWEKVLLDPDNTTISRNAIWFDYDGDHQLDVLILGDCPSRDACIDTEVFHLYRAVEDSRFVDVTNQTGITSVRSLANNGFDNVGGGLAVGDFNLDGFPDVVAARWNGQVYLFMNNGNGTFLDRSEWLNEPTVTAYYQPVVFDFDEDGWPDIFLAVDFNDPNKLWINQEGQGFIERGSAAGLDHREDDMGVAMGDYDNDGDYDLYITNIESNTQNANSLFQNNSTQQLLDFSEVAIDLGINRAGWAWGTTFFDANNDGWLDLAVTNGWTGVAVDDFSNDQSRLWRNDRGAFSDISSSSNFSDTLDARTLVVGDLDRDGDLDIVQGLVEPSSLGINIRVLTNELPKTDSSNYLVVKPRMTGQNHWAIGSNVEIYAGANYQQRPIISGTSFYGQEPAEAFFGIGSSTRVDSVIVTWPGGAQTLLHDVAANQRLEITDGSLLHAPTLLMGEQLSNDRYLLRWAHMITSQNGYEIERSKDSTFEEVVTFETVSRQMEDSTIEVQTTYYYRVRARNNTNHSDWSAPYKATVVRLLNAPENLRAELTLPLMVSLSWMNAENFETETVLERALNPEFEKALTFELSDVTVFSDHRVEPNTTYYYRVFLKNTETRSAYSNIARITTGIHVLGLNNSKDEGIRLIPNPVRNELKIEFYSTYLGELTLSITDLTGKVYLTTPLQKASFALNHLLRPELSAGMYLVEIEMQHTIITEKLFMK